MKVYFGWVKTNIFFEAGRLLTDLGQELLQHAEYPICRCCDRITDRYEPMKQALREAGA